MLKKSRTNWYECTYHLVWVTKYRKAIFNGESKRFAMKEILHEIAKNNAIEIEAMEVMPDHIHLVVSFDTNKTISGVLKSLKGSSAREWFKQYPETKAELWGGHLWSPSYFARTTGAMSQAIVMDYVKQQLTEYNAGRPGRPGRSKR